MGAALLLGVSYGFAGGISVGPTATLIVDRTLRRGWRAGALVALAPLCTDLPIIVLATGVLRSLPPPALGWVGVAGAVVILAVALDTLRAARRVRTPVVVTTAGRAELRGDFWRGLAVNALNPAPWLFWTTIGGPLLIRHARADELAAAAAFLVGFYTLLVGLKVALAVTIDRGRRWLTGHAYRAALTLTAVALFGSGVWLLAQTLPQVR